LGRGRGRGAGNNDNSGTAGVNGNAGNAAVEVSEGPFLPLHVLMQCPVNATLKTSSMSCEKYDAVVASVADIYNSLPSSCTADVCPQADFAGCVLRAAGHDFMDFSSGMGGADGCLDMNDADNAGLAACLHAGDEHGVSLATAYSQHCIDVSLADFLVIAAEAMMTETRAHVLADNNLAAPLDFRSKFRFGRSTATTCEFARGRLPNPENSCTDVQRVFVESLGLQWRDAAALMGVHTLGRAHVENSGYEGWWSDPENSRRFNNNYFVVMFANGWMAERAVGGNPNKNQWTRSDVGATHQQNVASKEMMLNTDICMAFNENGADLDASTHNCCAWVSPDNFGAIIANNEGEFCGRSQIPRGTGQQRNQCCQGLGNNNDCGNEDNPSGRASGAFREFAENEASWISAFQQAWAIVTENGFEDLSPVCLA